MVFTILGTLVFDTASDGVEQVEIHRHLATTVRLDGEIADAEGEHLMVQIGADSYFIPQLCKRRIVNRTNERLVVDVDVSVGAGESLNWHEMKSSEDHLKEMGESYA